MANKKTVITADEKLRQRVNYFKWFKDKAFVVITLLFVLTVLVVFISTSYMTGVHVTELKHVQFEMQKTQEEINKQTQEIKQYKIYQEFVRSELKLIKEKIK